VHSDDSKLSTLVNYLTTRYDPPILVFVSTQDRAGSLREQLALNGVKNVDCLHAGMSNEQRRAAVQRMLGGQSWVLVSTEIMARGMDFKGVRGVINYDFPTSVSSYIHRIGKCLI
jgi:ATP-dependent RNA helicase DDX52/ROK1